jgi:anoctamin-10
VPFGDYIVPKLDFFSVVLPRLVDDKGDITSRASFAVDSSRLKQQVIYFAVTGQIVQAIEEYFVPYITRKFFSGAKRITHTGEDCISAFDRPEEKEFLEKVREEIELPEYEIYEDYDEMVVQVCALFCRV